MSVGTDTTTTTQEPHSETNAGADPEKKNLKEIKEQLRDEYNDPDGFDDLFERIVLAETLEDWSRIIADHLSWGNNKIRDETAIWNFTSAHRCPNRETQEKGESETGLCQVPWDMCYAAKAERVYDTPLDYRNRQNMIWDLCDPETFSEAFIMVAERKVKYGNLDQLSEVDIRINEAGDFRSNQDIYKLERVQENLNKEDIVVYTYSASYKLDGWDKSDEFVTMQSVSRDKAVSYGHKEYMALAVSEEEIEEADRLSDLAPDNTVWCPHDLEKRQKGVTSDEAVSCGDCRLCLEKDGPDVAIALHK